MTQVDLQGTEQEFRIEIPVENADDDAANGSISLNFFGAQTGSAPSSDSIGWNSNLFEQQLEGGDEGRVLLDVNIPYGTPEQDYYLRNARIIDEFMRLDSIVPATRNAAIQKLADYGVDFQDYQFSLANTKPLPEADLPRLTEIKLDTSSVDLSSGAQAIALSFRSQDESGLRSASFGFSPVAYNVSDRYDSRNRSSLNFLFTGSPASGDNKNGTWVDVATLPTTSFNGDWELDYFSIYDTLGNRYYTSRSTDYETADDSTYDYTLEAWDNGSVVALQNLGLNLNALRFTVLNGTLAPINNSEVAPVVTDLALANNTIDLSDKTYIEQIFATAGISDNDDLGRLSFELSNTNNEDAGRITIGFGRNTLVAGSLSSGDHIAFSEASKTVAAGRYVVTSVRADGIDTLYRQWTGANGSRVLTDWSDEEIATLAALGIDPNDLEIEVTGQLRETTFRLGDPIFHQPDLSPVSWQEVDLSRGDQDLIVEVQINEPESALGVRYDSDENAFYNLSSYGTINWEGPDGTRISTTINAAELVSEENGISTYELRVPVSQDIAAGLWTMVWLDLGNSKGQRRSFTPVRRNQDTSTILSQVNTYEDVYGIEAETFGFIVKNDNYDPAASDKTAPTIQSASISSNSYQTGDPEPPYFEITVSDLDAGFGKSEYLTNTTLLSNEALQAYLNRVGTFRLTNEDGSSLFYTIDSTHKVGGNDKVNTYRVPLNLDASSHGGIWYVEDINVYDKGTNTLRTPSGLSFERNFQGRLYSSRTSEEAQASNRKKFDILNDLYGLDGNELKLSVNNSVLNPSEQWDAPNLADFQMNPSDSSDSGAFTATLRITDQGEGIGGSATGSRTRDTYGISSSIGSVRLIGPSGQQKTIAISRDYRVDGDEFDGSYEVPISLTGKDEKGIWRLSTISLEDDGGNPYSLPIRIDKRNLQSSGEVRTAAQAIMFDRSESELIINHTNGQVINDSSAPELFSVNVRTANRLAPPSLSTPPPAGSGGGSSNAPSSSPTTNQPASVNQQPPSQPTESPTRESTQQSPQVSPLSEVLNVQARVEVGVVELDTPIMIANVEISIAIVGTQQRDVITGSNASEALAGGEGRDKLTGGGGADAFVFETAGEFGRQSADIVTDFRSSQGDRIVISQEAFGGVVKIKLETVTGRKEAKDASASRRNFIYDAKSGMLYFNENGREAGLGDGGEFAKLLGAPELSRSDLVLAG